MRCTNATHPIHSRCAFGWCILQKVCGSNPSRTTTQSLIVQANGLVTVRRQISAHISVALPPLEHRRLRLETLPDAALQANLPGVLRRANSRSEDALHECCASDAQPMLHQAGSGKAKLCTLACPSDGQAVLASQELPVEVSRLVTIENGRSDVRSKVSYSEQRAEVRFGEAHARRCFVE